MQLSETSALKKACIYSLPPNHLGYCGPKGSWSSFSKFISNPSLEKAGEIKKLLNEFYALHPYLELIAKANNLDVFDDSVIEAYWIGNSLLENVPAESIKKTIRSFKFHGMPERISEEKAEGLPEGMFPHHSMHVLYINFISRKVEPVIENLSNCLVLWGEIKEVSEKGLKIKGTELLAEGGEIKLREKEKTVQNPLSLQPKAGDMISVHWNNAMEILSEERLNSLKKYTLHTLSAAKN